MLCWDLLFCYFGGVVGDGNRLFCGGSTKRVFQNDAFGYAVAAVGKNGSKEEKGVGVLEEFGWDISLLPSYSPSFKSHFVPL